MKQDGKTALLLILLCLFSLSPVRPVAADASFVFEPPSARLAAMGGSHAALTDDLGTLFANPAGFRSVPPRLAMFELTLGLSGPIFDIAGIILESASGVSGDDLLDRPEVQDLLRSLYAGFHLLGPLGFGYVGNGLGFGFFNRSGISFETAGSVPTVTTRIDEELLFCGGYAFRIPLPVDWDATLDAGVMLKGFARARSRSSKDILELLDAMADPLGLLLNEPFEMLTGVGLDLGLLYSWHDRLVVALVGRDLPSPVMVNEYASLQDFLDQGTPARSTGFLPPDLTLGFMIRPPLGRLGRYFQDLVLALDYHDLLDFWTHPATSRNPVLHVGMGLELTMLEILSLRAGLYQGLLSAGLGLGFGRFELSLSVFGRELSVEPGMRPLYNLLLGMEFRR